jgi:adenosylhomocysteine nucleosidase
MHKHVGVWIICFVSAVLLPSCHHPREQDVPTGSLAVLGAFEQEVSLLGDMLTAAKSRSIEGITFTSGRLDGTPIVLAWTGVGKVNAAMTTTLLLEHFQPAQVILTGIAGGVDPNLEPGDIVIAEQTAHHDMGILWSDGVEHGGVKNRLTGGTNPVFFPADPNLLAVARRAAERATFEPVSRKTGEKPPRVVCGTVVTGDTFVASETACAEFVEKLGADAVEMEGAAVAQVCYQRSVGCLVIRSIADKADESAIVDKQTFYATAAKNSATLVARMIEKLGP